MIIGMDALSRRIFYLISVKISYHGDDFFDEYLINFLSG